MASKEETLERKSPEEECSCCSEEAPSRPSASRSFSIQLTPVEETSCCSSDSVEEDCCAPEEQAEQTKSEEISLTNAYTFQVEGMDCPSCASTLQKGISRLSGVQEAKVQYPSGSMQVATDGTLAPAVIQQTVQRLGYDTELPAAEAGEAYNIYGMDCGSCAATVSKHFAQLDGVRDVQVQFATGKMTLDHELSQETVKEEVRRLGFDAAPVAERRASSGQPEASPLRGMANTIISGGLLLAGIASSLTPAPALISIILYLLVIVVGGYKPAKSAYFAIKSRSLDMNVLMMGAAIGAPLIGEYFEGALVVWLFALGNALQQYSVAKTRKSISHLMDLAPAEAWVKAGDTWARRPVEEVRLGQTMLIKPGEKIPLDGTIREGTSMVDQSPITGESLPIDKASGDKVYAGTLNDFGSLEVEVTARPEDTTLARIIHLVEEAQGQQAPTQSFVDRFAAVYTPIVFAAAIAVIVVPPVIGLGGWGDWVYRGLALLVVACPCALVISTPVAIVSAIGNAAKQGVLIKGGAFLEAAGTLNALAFDKTGTLTEGKPVVEKVYAADGDEDRLLSVTSTLEAYSNHPIARAITAYAREQKVSSLDGTNFYAEPGKGVAGTIEGRAYAAGKPEWLKEQGVQTEKFEEEVGKLQNEGMTVVLIGDGESVLGYVGVADKIRPMSSEAVKSLHNNGIRELTVLTGDNEGTAAKIAGQANIDRYMAGLLPEDKAKAVRTLQQEGRRVGMIGDGINDAPALATADIGIAMGGAGADTSMEAADIVLMADNLEKLPYTIRLSRKALRIIKQNIWFAVLIKVAALALIVPDLLTLWMAVLSDTGAALIVVANSLRLFRLRG
ncbi:heavy metal translocating P-type ATPase [Marinococcus sp. PL1-022]|uniref:heavy metal translocating P-type ATPase n=1 Tax=Marinococcus sp. PL1-022 TaxID=3095363 RepID=UPI0029C46E4A|nr:heavy metal translocating P-type ATPase [Marinococcus sp. PL1-022]MDX6152799.1 heavy metal translocating P-type ATPase [Marinococcus sp. PL1-022]